MSGLFGAEYVVISLYLENFMKSDDAKIYFVINLLKTWSFPGSCLTDAIQKSYTEKIMEQKYHKNTARH